MTDDLLPPPRIHEVVFGTLPAEHTLVCVGVRHPTPVAAVGTFLAGGWRSHHCRDCIVELKRYSAAHGVTWREI